MNESGQPPKPLTLEQRKQILRDFLTKQVAQGWTIETVDASEIDLPTIWAKVEQLSRVKR